MRFLMKRYLVVCIGRVDIIFSSFFQGKGRTTCVIRKSEKRKKTHKRLLAASLTMETGLD